ncbi:MAG: PASTA domain-containing protein [Muribaculaceae bacterium]|nr:PASTA domain-containing protein [Muribaculaceae bacterium]MBR3100474.1 PASTA domain-containing protein [Muribaculaceae bacterium]
MNKKKNNFFDDFRERHPILINAVLMLLAAFAIGYIAMLFIDVFTSHGQERKVPNVRNLTLEQAVAKLDAAGLNWDISDSTNYDETRQPGVVLDQDPKAGSFIKAIRTVYLKVNAMHAREVSLPRLTDISVRQGLAILRSMGFKNVVVDSVASPYKGLVLQVNVNGHQVAPGKMVPINAFVRLTIGDGSIDLTGPDMILDSATIDSIEEYNFQQELEQLEKEKAKEKEKEKSKDKEKSKHD